MSPEPLPLPPAPWRPAGTRDHYGQPVTGGLIAYRHAVWRVVAVTDLPVLDDADRDVWIAAGMPALEEWKWRPYQVDVDWVGGDNPGWTPQDLAKGQPTIRIPAGHGPHRWCVYPASGRWPVCSCCGEPMPCRAELQDREVDRGLYRVERLMSRMPGCCWDCGEPITARQKSVTYPGGNLDLPGGPEVQFHLRRSCRWPAVAYEQRWIAADPRHERILTWPACTGLLVVHADGSSECVSGPGPAGSEHQGGPDCGGHLTHDHDTRSACYVGRAWFANVADMPGCPRGCSPHGHPGTRTTTRPARPIQDVLPIDQPGGQVEHR